MALLSQPSVLTAMHGDCLKCYSTSTLVSECSCGITLWVTLEWHAMFYLEYNIDTICINPGLLTTEIGLIIIIPSPFAWKSAIGNCMGCPVSDGGVHAAGKACRLFGATGRNCYDKMLLIRNMWSLRGLLRLIWNFWYVNCIVSYRHVKMCIVYRQAIYINASP